MDAIKVENLVKKYHKGTVNAVDNISFTVRVGEFFAFLGPNGAGKSTTISILTTMLICTYCYLVFVFTQAGLFFTLMD